MKIDKDNLYLYEGTDIVARDGFELADGMGDVTLKSLWVKGDINIPWGSHLQVEGEIIHAGKVLPGGGFKCEVYYKGYTLEDEIHFQEDLAKRFPQLTDAEIRSICYR